MANKTLTIISGGQTGVDRAALDAAMAHDVPCGGWCPTGRKGEDGRIPDQYPLTELKNGGYRERTLRNLTDSDGTVVIYFERLQGGTKLTLDSCSKYEIPCLAIDGVKLTAEQATQQVTAFINEQEIKVLNVAGPRASGHPAAYEYAFQVMSKVLE
ncbi:MAG: putative molybdenum carrier protein [Gammaproteobacteria bacterium]|nr:putative molybdenum carrier protein [Gammaproteobacteria bacterium]